MATYEELRALADDNALRNRVEVAVIIAANNLLGGTPSIDEQKWAAAVFNAPISEGLKAFRGVLAENNAATAAQIQNATDAAIQTQVNALIPHLVVAYNAGP